VSAEGGPWRPNRSGVKGSWPSSSCAQGAAAAPAAKGRSSASPSQSRIKRAAAVDQPLPEVGEERRQHGHGRSEQQRQQGEIVVVPHHRVVDQLAHAGPREDRFGDQRAGDQRARVQRRHGQHRHGGVGKAWRQTTARSGNPFMRAVRM
jgi:hypothetical protein